MKYQAYNEKLLEETVSYISHCVGLSSQKDTDPDTLQFRWIDKYGVCWVTATFYFTTKNSETDLVCAVVLDCLPLNANRDKWFLLHELLTPEIEQELHEWLIPAEDRFNSNLLYPDSINSKDLFVKIDSDQVFLNAENLNITTHHTSLPLDKTFYIIQANIDGKWQDVIFSKGCNPAKKARHYRNKYGVDTRVVRIIEHKSYSYEYDVTNIYHPNSKES